MQLNKNIAIHYLIVSFIIFWIPAALNGTWVSFTVDFPVLFWVLDFCQWILFPGFALDLCIRSKDIITFQHLGFHNLIFHRRKTEYVVITSILCSILFYYSYRFLYDLSKVWLPDNPFFIFSYSWMIPERFPINLLALLYLSLSAGFVEEIFYRGLLRLVFQTDFTFNLKYIFFSSFLFSLNHWEGGLRNVIVTFLCGIMFATIYLKIKNIWPLVVGHSVTDFILFSS